MSALLVAAAKLQVEARELIRCRDQYKATEVGIEKTLALDIYIAQWKAFERALRSLEHAGGGAR